MKWWESAVHILGITFFHYAYIKSYSLLFKKEIKKINFKVFFILLVITILSFYNTFYNYSFSKLIISFIGTFIILKLMFKDNTKDTFIKSLLIYLLGWVLELIFSIIFIYFIFESLQQIDQSFVIKFLFSILISLMLLLWSYNKILKRVVNSIYKYMNNVLNLTIIIVFFVICLATLAYYLIVNTDVFSSVALILLLIVLIFLFITSIVQIIKGKKADEKQEILLNFMKEYEILIDNERMIKHEMINNLLVLKSIKNRNSKEYEKVLEEIIDSYKSKKSYKGLYDLPSGLKGLFYYKLYDMKNKNIEVFMNVSDQAIKKLDSLNPKLLSKTCKILGTLLDNASEAAEQAKDKLVVIDIYEEENDIVLYIENTMNKEKININILKEKGFSTKGKNRGYGLYLVEKILKDTKNISLLQEQEHYKFISIVKIKK